MSCEAPQTLAGHTGYLTVATLPPTFARFSQDAVNGVSVKIEDVKKCEVD